jgi:hypothetical protein
MLQCILSGHSQCCWACIYAACMIVIYCPCHAGRLGDWRCGNALPREMSPFHGGWAFREAVKWNMIVRNIWVMQSQRFRCQAATWTPLECQQTCKCLQCIISCHSALSLRLAISPSEIKLVGLQSENPSISEHGLRNTSPVSSTSSSNQPKLRPFNLKHILKPLCPYRSNRLIP